MGDGIGLHEAGLGDVRVVSTNGDLVFEQAAGAGACEALSGFTGAHGLEDAVNGGGTHAQQGLAYLGRQRAVQSLIAGQPERDGGVQLLGTHLIGGEPETLEHCQQGR